jgi:hypothetical protein
MSLNNLKPVTTKTMKIKIAIPIALLSFFIIWSACTKEKVVPTQGKAHYSVRLTDAPGPYTAVNVDIQAIEITSNTGTASLNINPGVYNLLNFTNGVDTLIATGDLDPGRVQQIRLILGENNSLAAGSATYALEVPSSAQSGLKLQVHQTLEAGVAYQLLLDFDANQSIVMEGNGSYKLKPVIRVVETALSGAIKGQLAPSGVPAAVTASSSTGAYSSAADANGYYLIRGVPAGTYTVFIAPAAPYNATSVNNVQVTTGVTTTLALINL